jgi:hypothetical protein
MFQGSTLEVFYVVDSRHRLTAVGIRANDKAEAKDRALT